MNNPSTEKRLVEYAMQFKKTIFIGLFCLIIAVALELTGPFIAKKLIDDHIVAVANHYVESEDESAITYNGLQLERLHGEGETQVFTLFQDGLSFYFLHERVPLDAKLVDSNNGQFQFEYQDRLMHTTGEKLTPNDVFLFFKREIEPILWLLWLIYWASSSLLDLFVLPKRTCCSMYRIGLFKKCAVMHLNIFNGCRSLILSINRREPYYQE